MLKKSARGFPSWPTQITPRPRFLWSGQVYGLCGARVEVRLGVEEPQGWRCVVKYRSGGSFSFSKTGTRGGGAG